MIDINLLSKKYGEQTVLDIDVLKIPSGQTFGLVGNNGALVEVSKIMKSLFKEICVIKS